MSKQTAVEWLIEQIQNRQNGVIKDFPVLSLDEIFEQAKAMEKEQHGNTWDDAIKTNERRSYNLMRSLSDFDDYYNEIYGGDNAIT